VGLALACANTALADPPLQFNRDVRPILSAACWRCHGQDQAARQADLRLDQAESAFLQRDGGPAIAPSEPDQSQVWQRVHSSDADKVMPPPDAPRQLTDQEKTILKKWIEQGAPFQKHWSFEAIRPTPPPTIVAEQSGTTSRSTLAEAWSKGTIDRFLWDAMQPRGLQPQAMADKPTLIRRVAFALTGLPPTVDEVAQFEADGSDRAYEAMVDRYLSSPRYGEEMARHWLDVARYGDTHGLHLDNERQMWAYRDWVVEAFNRNLPFSDFTIEQLAGDLLLSPTQSQLIATGFNRCNVTTSEGGAIVDEFLFRYAVDRASTTIQTWMGLTGGCAVCHDHKYDPLTMQEFYSIYAFFYSAADPAMDGNIAKTEPFLNLSTPAQEEQLRRLKDWSGAERARLTALAKESQPKETRPSPFEQVLIDDRFPSDSQLRNTTRNAEAWSDSEELEIPRGLRALKQAFGHRYEQSVSGMGPASAFVPKAPKLNVWIRLDEDAPPQAMFLEIKTSQGTKNWIWASSDDSASLVGNPKNRIGELPNPGTWSMQTVEGDRIGLSEGAEIQEIKLGQFGGVCWWDGLTLSGSEPAEQDPRRDYKNWWATRKDKSTPLASGDLDKALKAGPDAEKAAEHDAAVREFFHAYVAWSPAVEVGSARRSWERAEVEWAMAEADIPGTFIFRDQPKPRQAHIMLRGAYDKPGEAVQPDTPEVLPKRKQLVSTAASPSADATSTGAPSADSTSTGAPSTEPPRANRLDLARWLVSEDHPLTARVTVNRFWQQIFGVGIVKTSEDFGSQGTPPVLPELLDTLAHEFRAQGWNVKQLIRQMVCSQAFRQSSLVTKEALEKDPENRLLSRGPRLRLDAEQVRDNALSVSGLLSLKLGGPGAKTYQPPNIWEPVGYGDSNTRYYLRDKSPQLYRRSLYCFIKRTAPPPFMSNFDAPNREQFCARRERSNTPLQALQLMNDIQHVEAARHLAQRLIKEGGHDDVQRVRFAYRTVLARWPNEVETDVALRALSRFRERYQQAPADAVALVCVGQSPRSSTVSETELAAHTLLANLILNLDETINRN
jgi:hypothetical protein